MTPYKATRELLATNLTILSLGQVKSTPELPPSPNYHNSQFSSKDLTCIRALPLHSGSSVTQRPEVRDHNRAAVAQWSRYRIMASMS
ncbi:hypothetical protein TNCV_2672801 [Trichonephila clavipes]|nr:hypothetical protein TNCV_2672801 [Trichonephila clavipes]